MPTDHLFALANHLWQSTLFTSAALLLTLALRKNRAQTRYCLWMVASIKFLIPFSLLVRVGSRFASRSATVAVPPLSPAIEQISQPFAPPVFAVPAPAAPSLMPYFLLAVWWFGCIVVLFRWGTRWWRIRNAFRAASPIPIQLPVRVISSPTLLEPGVLGIFRPVILLPEGIAGRLAPDQLRAILAHELCHIRRRDNLAAALHMLVEAIFWFHPLVWWIGARLIEEREQACDEEVLRRGNQPQAYAEGILNVCKFYLESPLACAAGVTGSDLKKRIEAIMTHRNSYQLTLARKLLLAAAGAAAVAGPILVGITHAQSKAEALTFEVASVKPADPAARGIRIRFSPGGGLDAQNAHVKQLIMLAYDVQSFQVSGGPGWLDSQGFDILAKAPPAAGAYAGTGPITPEQRKQIQQRIQALLADRFQLVIHRDSREAPVYALVVAKNGHKMKESVLDEGLRGGRGTISADGVDMTLLAGFLGGRLGRPVLERTGLTGKYDFKLEWTPESSELSGKGGPEGPGEKGEAAGADPLGPSLSTALQEQLGLKLESRKAPVETLVIDRAEKPSAN